MAADTPLFAGVHNFRDVGHTINTLIGKPLLRTGRLYRAGRLDDATPADRRTLVNDYGLRTVVDLRTKSEHVRRAQVKAGKNRYAAAAAVETGVDEKNPLLGGEHKWHTIRVNFVGRQFEMNLVGQLKWWQIVWFFLLMLLQFRMAAIRLLGQNVLRPKGLRGLSQDSLRYCQPGILQALDLMIDADAYPLLVHCTQGKDRSGLIVMLALFVLGVPLDAVRADYALSNQGLAPVREKLLKEVFEIGMDEEYLKAPPEVVDCVWQFLNEEYGGVDAYLDGIGFGADKRRALVALLKT